MKPVYETADAALRGMLREVIDGGVRTEPRGKLTLEVTAQTAVIRNPRARVCASRMGLRRGYPAALLAWNLASRNDVESLARWNPNAKMFSDDGETVQGEDYGRRMERSLQSALYLLQQDRHTRRAWVGIWDAYREYDLPNPKDGFDRMMAFAEDEDRLDEMPALVSSNVPCCIGFDLRVIGGRLVMQTVMRSQSLWGVFPYDVFLFTVLQELIANELDVELGWYEHVMLSAHVYEHDLANAKKMIAADPVQEGPMEPLGLTLGDAAARWPFVFEALTDPDSESAKRFVPDADVNDPVEKLMWENAGAKK